MLNWSMLKSCSILIKSSFKFCLNFRFTDELILIVCKGENEKDGWKNVSK